jgi:hypothetical protein
MVVAVLHVAAFALVVGGKPLCGIRHRTLIVSMGAPMDCPILSNLKCPLTSRSQNSTTSAPRSSAPRSFIDNAASFIDDVESRLLKQAGLTEPMAITAIKQALDALVRAGCDEVGSLDISIVADSSAGLLLRGKLASARIEARSVSAAGLRASAATLSSAGLEVDIGSLLDARPPNLRSATTVDLSVRLTQDDIMRSPVLFAALQEILRTLLRTGASAAIGQQLPEGALNVQLVNVESLTNGRLVLVADAEATQSDGSVVRLQGMRVRTRPRASPTTLVLDFPELISTFEGFGAKLEFGLPFLRAAGIPLPKGLTLGTVSCDDGVLFCAGALELQPIDYDAALLQLQELAAEAAAAAARQEQATAAAARARAPSAVDVDLDSGNTVDVPFTSDGDEAGGAGAGTRALPPSRRG